MVLHEVCLTDVEIGDGILHHRRAREEGGCN
jgi:hypothetical protein